MTIAASGLLHAGSAMVCLAWTALVLSAGRGRAALLPAAACAVAALWAAAVAVAPETPLEGAAGALEILRGAVWLTLLVSLCRRIADRDAARLASRFAWVGGGMTALALASLIPGAAGALALPTLGSPALLARIGLALLVVLLAENLYRNADETLRWHVNLPCIALGGLSALDVLLYADAALSRAFSPALLDARAALTALAMPLLAIAAVRDRRWRRDPPLSRQVVFHGATLMVAGAFLLGVGAAGEALRHLGADWGRAAQVSLLAGAVMALAVAATSGSTRSRVRRLVVDHFFTARYDYRREWLRCVAALSAPDHEALAPIRAIRAIADAVDSPAGVLLLRDAGEAGLGHGRSEELVQGLPRGVNWAGSWNLPAEPVALAADHPLLVALRDGEAVVAFATADQARPAPGSQPAEFVAIGPVPADLSAAFGPLWLGVPLVHHRGGLLGAVLLAPPRVPFALDREVFDLLRTLGGEVAMFLAERRAAERLAEQRRLADYAKRFAFVAHDVKTVSSQLTLLLANAEDNLQDPEFQRDMLLTVRASATRINALIARLRQPETVTVPEVFEPQVVESLGVEPMARLRALALAWPHPVQVEADGPAAGFAAIAPERFDAAVTHLLDNAVEASRAEDPVRIRVRQEAGHIMVEIVDRGMGMTPEFIRDELFRPLSTSKSQGNGIGAWQARDLLREAGGDLTVQSQPGAGTTMRLTLRSWENGAAAEPRERRA